MKLVLQIAGGIVGAVLALVILTSFCTVCDQVATRQQTSGYARYVDLKVIRWYDYGNAVTVEVSGTNRHSERLNRIEVLVTAYGGSNGVLGSDRGYVAYATKGGIAPGQTLIEEFYIEQVQSRDIDSVGVTLVQVF